MNVPKLRFREFSVEWEVKNFADVFSGFEYGMNAAAGEFDGTNKYIRITDIDESSHKYIGEGPVSPMSKLEDKYRVKENDILFARTGASTGKTYLYSCEDGILYYAGFLIRSNVKTEYSSYFIFAITLLHEYDKWVSIESTRSGQPGINAQQYLSFSFACPTLPEQQKIAEFLSAVDEKINNQQSIVKSLEAQKKGFMQKIFSQKLRFKDERDGAFPEWEENLFSEYIVLYRGSSPRPIQKYLTKKDDGVNWIKIGDTKKSKNFIISEVEERITVLGAQKSRHVFDGELILANSMSFGKTYKLALDGYIYDGWFVLREYENCFNKLYLIQYLNSEFLQKQYMRLSAGGVVQNISSDIVYNTSLQCPSLPEQEKIANFLSTYDEKIDAEKQILIHWKTIKKALLQQMFV